MAQANVSGSDDRQRGVAQEFRALCPLLVCPKCRSSELSNPVSGIEIICRECATHFPVFRCGNVHIPWMFPEPGNTRLEWKARYNGFLHANSVDLARLRQARGDRQCSTRSHRRISKLLQANEQYRKQVIDILAPLGLDQIDWPADATGLLQSKLPKNQGLLSYTNNFLRDWVWDNGENEALLDAVDRVLQADTRSNIGSIVTLGSGAGRLSYDMHRRYEPDMSVVLDHNPCLLHLSGQIIQGQEVSLYEFPIAPLNEASFSVLQNCRAPAPLVDRNFYYLLADALNPPVARESCDTIVTPWLIDIITENLRTFIPRINQSLVEGGVWVNTGSLAFFHRDETWCYSEEEVLEMVEANGFEILASERRTIPYLQSPHSAHGRTEEVLSFSAVKTHSVDAEEKKPYIPAWVLNTSRAVPSSTETEICSSNYVLKAQVLALVDGKRTINQIARMVARQYGLGLPETIHAVKHILIDLWEEANGSQFDRGF